MGTELKRATVYLDPEIRSLSSNPGPSGCEQLSADQKYRILQVRYRILYSNEDNQLIQPFIKIGPGKTFIDNLK